MNTFFENQFTWNPRELKGKIDLIEWWVSRRLKLNSQAALALRYVAINWEVAFETTFPLLGVATPKQEDR